MLTAAAFRLHSSADVGNCVIRGLARPPPPLGFAEVTDDPHMFGLLGQRIDWKGEAGNWYALVHDGVEKQIAVRLTSPLPEEFPDRQLVTGVSLVSTGGHSLIIEADNPYTTETAGCPPDMMVPCLAEGSLRITVDGEQTNFLVSPSEKIELPGGESKQIWNNRNGGGGAGCMCGYEEFH